MTSAELPRIVGAMTSDPPHPFDCPDDVCAGAHHPSLCPWLLGTEAIRAAHEALANHADALVALVEACEMSRDWNDIDAALAALRAVKGTP